MAQRNIPNRRKLGSNYADITHSTRFRSYAHACKQLKQTHFFPYAHLATETSHTSHTLTRTPTPARADTKSFSP